MCLNNFLKGFVIFLWLQKKSKEMCIKTADKVMSCKTLLYSSFSSPWQRGKVIERNLR